MTDLESLLAAGLSREEAEMVLARRAAGVGATTVMVGGDEVMGRPVKPAPLTSPLDRLARARAVHTKANKKVGARPVLVDEYGIVQGPVPEEDLAKFYETKGGVKSTHLKPDPDTDGWEDPP